MAKYYFEDFQLGDKWEFGSWSLTRDQLVSFAREHDPQPIHIDEKAAGEGPYGGLIASGWQTMIKCVRPFMDELLAETAGFGSPGMEELRWLKPVRAGDAITPRAEIYEIAPSRSRPDRGRIHIRFSGIDAAGDEVIIFRSIFFFGRRPADRSPAQPRPGESGSAISNRADSA